MAQGVGIVVEISGLKLAESLLAKILAFDETELLTAIGAMGESQTRRRISDEKTAPDGAAWPPNREGTSILLRTGGNLLGSVAYIVGSGEVQWGASWEFAHIHQDGAKISAKNAKALFFRIGGQKVAAKSVTIPARPFVGLSDDNRKEIEELVTDVFGRLVQ
ncbi:MAG: phage virion morphogenesis protein [Rhodoblastus sp.]|nr:phage virion morphogenesis protein [Rhodoblastus sp.]